MIKVSKLADYAVVVLAMLAQSDTAQMNASGVSAKTGLPEPTVAKVLKLLAKEEIVRSIRGVNGGYKLSMSPDSVNVAQIIKAIDGPIMLTACAVPVLSARVPPLRLIAALTVIGPAVAPPIVSVPALPLNVPPDCVNVVPTVMAVLDGVNVPLESENAALVVNVV